MRLKKLDVNNVRNLSNISLNLGHGLNIFHGENGSGKSSILESIYILSSARSFRTRNISKVITYGESQLNAYCEVLDQEESLSRVGIQKSRAGNKIRIDGNDETKVSELAIRLPVLAITQDSHELIDGGPKNRREFLDWGLFHVEQSFAETWMNYRRLLKQRNLALQNNASEAELDAWNIGLAEAGENYSLFRENFVKKILPFATKYINQLTNFESCEFRYKRGWPKEVNLRDSLSSSAIKDIITGRTECGPHRADLQILVESRDAKDIVSRGQQKLLVLALNLAQIELLKSAKGKETLLLLDDIGSELDFNHLKQLLTLLSEEFTQVCITTANLEALPLNDIKHLELFHVKQGTVKHHN